VECPQYSIHPKPTLCSTTTNNIYPRLDFFAALLCSALQHVSLLIMGDKVLGSVKFLNWTQVHL